MKQLTLATSPWAAPTNCFPFDEVFDFIVDGHEEGFKNADAFVLWGGTDIHPSYYNHDVNIHTHCPTSPSERDIWEWKAMKYCKANNIPMIGVCRGAQFLCAFAGGKLIQHVNGHVGGQHQIVDLDGEVYPVTSAHHQMLDLEGVNAELLAWTPTNLSNIYYQGKSETPEHIQAKVIKHQFKEPEIVYFPEINSLGVQGHPEWMTSQSTLVKKFNQMIVDYLLTKKEWK